MSISLAPQDAKTYYWCMEDLGMHTQDPKVKPGEALARATAEATLSKDPRITSRPLYPQNGAIVLDLAAYPGRITRAELARILGFRPTQDDMQGFSY